ncbi:MAG: ABC transporter ATP-binding protein [Kofleriaceae bacterium]|nr:ABC transporter ATP-binding protein [Kofleriaceae bacterium]
MAPAPSQPSAPTRAGAGSPTAWTYLGRYQRPIWGGVVMLLATNVLFLGIPITIERAVAALRGHGDLADVPVLALAMMGFALATAVTRIYSRVWIFNAGRAAEYDLRSDLFGHLLAMEPAYFRANPTGDVMSRLTNDVQTVRAMWGAGLLNLVNTAFAFASVLIMMFRVDWVLTLWALLPYPVIYVVGQMMGKRIYKRSQAVQAELGALSSALQEDLGGVQLIKNYGLEDVRRAKFRTASLRLLDRNMALARTRLALPLLAGIVAIGTLIVLWVGGNRVIAGQLPVESLIAFSLYVGRLVWPTLALGWMLSLVQRGRASWSRLVSLLERPSQLRDGDGPPLTEGGPGTLELRGLTIRAGERLLLDGVTATMAAGTVTAIVGRTGAGKSTLTDALCRLCEVPAGMIFLDGRDLTTLPLASLRAAVGYAPQEAFLFSTTIADNIAMGYGGGRSLPRARADELEQVGARLDDGPDGDPLADARVTRAARAAGLERDLAAMPEGLGTIVGERGITLSGGQRQRVALARAIAAERRVLILDDSLSSVDAETEKVILGHLTEVMRGRTSILISHRVAAVKTADQILVLDQGHIVERGSHAELLASGGLYAELYHSQLDPDAVRARGAASASASADGGAA